MNRRIFSFLGISIATLVLLVSYTNCAKTESSAESNLTQQQNQNAQFYFHQMKTLVVDVVYEPGAEPFVGTTATGMSYWDLLEDNLVAIFQKQSMLFQVPHTLTEMRTIPAQGKVSWTPDQVLTLAAQYRNGNNDQTTGRFFVVFLKGNAADSNGAVNPNVLGFSVSGTNVIAMFKDVIKSTGTNPNGLVPRYVEQSTMVHEMGHALGFVNNGLPVTSAHHDSAHGAHCTNPNCVMYYLNEGKNDAINFVQNYITSGNTVMLDNACLQDSGSF
jgi:hypothetical protein